MRSVLNLRGYSYRITDLSYPAIGVNFATALGAYISAGKYYSFGKSVNAGVKSLRDYYYSKVGTCKNTKWIFGGYSQGAMVIAEGVKPFKASQVEYIGLFGDPQLNLPEGFPGDARSDACRGRNLSPYRVYVPNCATDEGILGARNPYEYGDLDGRYGLWCNYLDFICGSAHTPFTNIGHSKYVDYGNIGWMGLNIMRRIPNITTDSAIRNAKLSTLRIDVGDNLFALLKIEQYAALLNDEIEFDASESFNTNGLSIVEYEWDFDGVIERTLSSIIRKSFPTVGEHALSLRVKDSNGN